jgi:cysteinyl-tRNA synthetase
LAGRLSGVESWGYQLQHVNLDELAVSDFDLLVIDYADDTGEPFTADQIERLQASGKIVLSYFSIGEAEIYRPYWNPAWVTGGDCDAPLSDDAPGWLEEANPDWCGNYPVQYWDVEWQAIIMGYLDAILAAGFDGVYLDKVDSFYAWTGEEDLGSSFAYSNAAVDMAALVEAIAARGRAADPHFLVVPQNAAEIIEYLDGDQRAAYLAAIDGIGVGRPSSTQSKARTRTPHTAPSNT